MSIRNLFFTLTIAVFSLAANAVTQPLTVSSPDKKIKVVFHAIKGKGVSYDVTFSGEAVLQNSKLGLTLKNADHLSAIYLTWELG